MYAGRMANRIGQFLPPPDGPDPKGDKGAPQGGAMPDLSQESLAAGGGKQGPAQEPRPDPDEPVRQTNQPIPEQSAMPYLSHESLAANRDAPSLPPRLSEEEREQLCKLDALHLESTIIAARAVRAAADQSEAPPVDDAARELIRLAVWDQLPEELMLLVTRLAIRYRTWGLVAYEESIRRLRVERDAELN